MLPKILRYKSRGNVIVEKYFGTNSVLNTEFGVRWIYYWTQWHNRHSFGTKGDWSK